MFFANILELVKYWVLPVLDILAVSWILYNTYKILYGTRAILVLNGLAVIIGIYFISIFLNLHTLNLLIKIFFTYGVITFIVVFHPEIRRALMNVGENRIFLFGQKDEINVIGKLINTVKALSGKNMGALIIIKRKVGLRNIEHTGVKIDAFVTNELLMTIFMKNTPLHDGAVIIDNNRISYAACFLPLSEKKLPIEYGTRHHAALGLSEESDAIVLVVSEETGHISLAYKGELKTNLDTTTLKNELSRLIREF